MIFASLVYQEGFDFGEAFVRIISNGKASLIDLDYLYLIRKGFIRLVT